MHPTVYPGFGDQKKQVWGLPHPLSTGNAPTGQVSSLVQPKRLVGEDTRQSCPPCTDGVGEGQTDAVTGTLQFRLQREEAAARGGTLLSCGRDKV